MESPASPASSDGSPAKRRKTLSSRGILQQLQQDPAHGINTPFAKTLYFGLSERALTFNSISEQTRKSYLKAFTTFQSHVDVNSLTLDNLDATVADYGQQSYEDDPRPASRTALTHLMSYLLITQPAMRSHFSQTQRVLKTWRKTTPSASATPLSRKVMLAFTNFFHEQNDTSAALCMLLSWGGLLRVSEALALRRHHISLPSDPRPHDERPSDIGVALDATKTGPDQYVFISDKVIVKLIIRFIEGMENDALVIPLTYHEFSKKMREASLHFDLIRYSITSHSNRIGGALHLFLTDVSAEDIKIRGRWKCQTSLEHYLRNGRHWMATMRLTDNASDLITRAAVTAQDLADDFCPSDVE